MASIKLDKYGIYPLDFFHAPTAWITPEDILQGLYALSRECKAEGNLPESERLTHAADALMSSAWLEEFMKYKNNSLRAA